MRFKIFKHHHCKPFSQRECPWRVNLLAAVIVLVLAACAAVGPDYVPVEPKAPSKWQTDLEDGLNEAPLNPETMAQWWTTINDPQLTSLEQRAVKGNLDLQQARARIREARALRGISQAQLFPTVDTTVSITRNRSSESTGTGSTETLYAAGFDAGWELDIFGGLRRAVEAAQADLEASQQQLHDVLVSLLAEVALNYLEVRTFQARLAVTEKNIKAQQETYELNHSRYQAGIISELPVKQALYNLERSRSQIPILQTGLAAAKNRLAVLLGESPGVLDDELEEMKPIPVPPVSVAVGLPAETLRHRPDIRRAERNLAAQTARIGVATADLYPKFRLFGSIGLESLSDDDFLEWSNRTWGIGPGASWNIFDAGAIRQNIEVQTARQEQALIQYESTVLRALEEVEDVLVAYAKVRRRREYLAKATEAARQADLLARDQFSAGLVDFSNVLITQLALLSLEDDLARSEGAATSTLVRLYKALGGGWKSLEPDSPSIKK
ncbi:MAG: efflux transporter outer membrane subunit [Desulfobacterales bacterium]|jgi:NodT family efflux transporter outer membrane factor (OMF) lipoprotein